MFLSCWRNLSNSSLMRWRQLLILRKSCFSFPLHVDQRIPTCWGLMRAETLQTKALCLSSPGGETASRARIGTLCIVRRMRIERVESETWILFFPLGLYCLCCCVGFSLVVASRGYSLVAILGLLIAVASLVVEYGGEGTWASVVAARGFSSCDFRALEHGLNSHGAHAAQHVGSSCTRGRTHVSCTGRRILHH